MRNFISFAVFILFSAILLTGCDSPTETKATSVTAPTLSEPADNATGVSRTPHFKWTGSADKLEYATNSTFDNAVSNDVSGTEFTLATPLSANTTYFWRAGKMNGTSIVWCSTYLRFTTGN
jgi:lysyl endopeptidase